MSGAALSAGGQMRRLRDTVQAIQARQGSFKTGSAITIAFNGVSIMMMGVGSILIARALGPEQAGYLVWFITGTTTIALFADTLGIYLSNAHLLASGGCPTAMPVVRATVLAYGAVVGLAAGILFGWLPVVRAAAFAGFGDPLWGLLISLNILGLVLVGQARGLFLGQRRFLWLGTIVFVKSGVYVGVGVAFAYGLSWHAGSQIAIAHVVSTWACVVASVTYFVALGVGRPSVHYLRACMGVGWRAASVNWLSFAHQRADQYLVNTLLGPAAVGLYGVATAIGELLTQVPAMLGLVLFPIAAGDPDRARTAQRTLKLALVLMLGLAVLMLPLVWLAPTLIRTLYGEQFLPSAGLLFAFMPAIVALAGLLLVNQHLAGLGYPLPQLLAMAVSLALNVSLNLLLLPSVGMIGAPIAGSLSYTCWFLFVGAYLVSQAYPTTARRFLPFHRRLSSAPPQEQAIG